MQCAICLGIPDKPTTMKCCKNSFCTQCIGQWMKIRNICPLCCAETGEEKINNLKKKISNETFDDGSLIIQAEMQQIRHRVKFISERVENKRQQFRNCKSSISSSLMQYLEVSLQEIQSFQSAIDEEMQVENRGRVFELMQLTVESILALEKALDHNTISSTSSEEQFQYQDQEEQLQDEQASDNQYDQYEYQVNLYKKGNGRDRKFKNNSNQGSGSEQKLRPVKQN